MPTFFWGGVVFQGEKWGWQISSFPKRSDKEERNHGSGEKGLNLGDDSIGSMRE